MLYTNTNLGKKGLVPALAGQYTVQFVFRVVLEVWAEITKLVQGGLRIISKILRHVKIVYDYVYTSYLHTVSEDSLGRAG